MENIDKKEFKNWNKEERDRMVGAFAWLIKEDKKQNPHLYTLEKGRVDKDKKLK